MSASYAQRRSEAIGDGNAGPPSCCAANLPLCWPNRGQFGARFNGVDYLHITYGPTSQHAEDLQPRRLTPPPTVAGGDGKSVG